MKKKLLLILSLFLFWGCQKPKTVSQPLPKDVTLSFFYIETCSECIAFKKQAIPYLKDMFGDTLIIHQYNLDAKETEQKYDQVIDALDQFDQQHYGKGPFYALEGYFANLGYIAGDEEELARDIQKAVNGEELGYELEAYRYLYKS